MKNYLIQLKDQLRAGADVMKRRVQIVKLGYERETRRKERQRAVDQLGEYAWRKRIEHQDYAPLFAQLVELEQQRTDVQATVERLHADIRRLEAQKAELEQQFATRMQNQRQQAAAARQDSGSAAQIEQHMATLRSEHLMSLQPIEAQLKQLRQELRDIQQRMAPLDRQSRELQHALGEQIDRTRPVPGEFVEHYARIDALDQEIARIDEQIDRLNRQVSAAGAGAGRAIYAMIGGGIVLILLLLAAVSSLSWFSFGGGAVSEQQIRRDLEGRQLNNDLARVIWEIRSDQVQELKVLRRSGDRDSGIERIAINIKLRDNLMTVSSNLELLYKKYGDTWRLYEVKSDRILHLVSAQNEPDTSDLDSLVRDAHYDLGRRDLLFCDLGRLRNFQLESKQGGESWEDGRPTLVYIIKNEYNPLPTAPPGRLQAPDFCSGKASFRIVYKWNGSNWGSPSYYPAW